VNPVRIRGVWTKRLVCNYSRLSFVPSMQDSGHGLHPPKLPLVELPLVELPLAELHLVELHLAELHLAELHLAELHLAELHLAELPLAELPLAELPLAELPLAERTRRTTALAYAAPVEQNLGSHASVVLFHVAWVTLHCKF
jgi:hypothetical protein